MCYRNLEFAPNNSYLLLLQQLYQHIDISVHSLQWPELQYIEI